MDLTSGPVVLGAVLVALAAVVAVPWTWDCWRRPRPSRSATVVLATTTVLLALGAGVNRQAGFFPTVQSLVTGQGAALTSGHGGEVAALTALPVDLSVVRSHHVPGHGVVLGALLKGARSGIARTGAVYLPDAYFDPTQTGVRFPVVEVLSGSPGSPAQTLRLLHLAETLDASTADHRTAPTVVVVPDTNGSPVRDRECVDAAGGVADDTYLTTDLQQTLAQHFRVQGPGRGWALLGTSTGGYCAVDLALRHPGAYAAAASLSGYFHALTDVTTGDLFHGVDRRHANDPTWRVQHLPLPPVALWLSAGTGEVRELADLQHFAAVLPPGADLTTVVVPGAGHAFPAWTAVLPQALSWASSRLPPPLAPATPLTGQGVAAVRDAS